MEVLDLRIETDSWVEDPLKKLRGTVRVKVGEVKVDCTLDKEECRDILNSINQERIREKIKE